MSLKLIYGRAGSGKTLRCLDEMRRELMDQPEGAALILVTPEQATFALERELASTPGLGGFMRAHVLGFRRLAYRVLLETGGAVRPHISDLGKRLVLKRLLQQHRHQLKAFNRAAGQRTFTDILSESIREFKTYGISPQSLAQTAALLEQTGKNAALAGKLHDLGLIYQGYEQFLQGRYTNPEDYLNLLAAQIPAASFLAQAQIWIDGFDRFTPQEYRVLEKLLATAAQVTITLCLDQPQAKDHQHDTALFHRQWDTRCRLLESAASLGQVVVEEELGQVRRFAATPLLNYVEQHFYAVGANAWQGDTGNLMLVEAANQRVELEGVARDIIRLCRSGYRYRDITVLLCNMDTYADLAELVLTEHDIPFFIDRKRPVVHHPVAELLRSAVEVVTGRWGYEAVFRTFKTGFFDLDQDEINKLENYVLEFGIRGSRWTKAEPWCFIRRYSLGDDAEGIDSDAAAHLDRINDIRRRVVRPLADFEQQLKQAKTIQAMTLALYSLLNVLDVPGKLASWAQRETIAGSLDAGREDNQIWQGIINLFDQFAGSLGEEEVTLDEYAEMLDEGLAGLTLSLIPPGIDHINVTSLERSRGVNARAVYLPGINEGALPRKARDEGLLNDEERRLLKQAGLELAPGRWKKPLPSASWCIQR